jgi:hypothetical protein
VLEPFVVKASHHRVGTLVHFGGLPH